MIYTSLAGIVIHDELASMMRCGRAGLSVAIGTVGASWPSNSGCLDDTVPDEIHHVKDVPLSSCPGHE